MGIGADGMKTGFTKEAGYGLVGSAVQNGLRLIVVVNGFKTMKERADEARKLLEWGFRSFEARHAVRRGRDGRRGEGVRRRQGARAAGRRCSAIRLLVPRDMREKLSRAGRLYRPGARAGRRRASRSAR